MWPAAASSSLGTNLRFGRTVSSAEQTTMWWREPVWALATRLVPCIQRGHCKWQVLLCPARVGRRQVKPACVPVANNHHGSYRSGGSVCLQLNEVFCMQFACAVLCSFAARFSALSRLIPRAHLHRLCVYMVTHKCTPLVYTCIHTPKHYFQFALVSKPWLAENGLQLSARYSPAA